MKTRIGLITSRVTERLIGNMHGEDVDTPFGKAPALIGSIGRHEVVCFNRNGPSQTIPSHKVNFRAMIWALKKLGATRVIAQNAIGSVNPALRPGDIVIPHDLIDHTKTRTLSFFDQEQCWVRVDMTNPFCPDIRQALLSASSKLSDKVYPSGVFVCVEGPRFETPAEIRIYQSEGGDIIGTPMIPEAVLAREAELCYASIAPVMNYGAGLAPTVTHVGPGGMIDEYYLSGLHELVEDTIMNAIDLLPESRRCSCQTALRGAFHGPKPEWLVGTSLNDTQENYEEDTN